MASTSSASPQQFAAVIPDVFSDCTLAISGIPREVTLDDLLLYFRTRYHGKVKRCTIIQHSDHESCGFLTFECKEQAVQMLADSTPIPGTDGDYIFDFSIIITYTDTHIKLIVSRFDPGKFTGSLWLHADVDMIDSTNVPAVQKHKWKTWNTSETLRSDIVICRKATEELSNNHERQKNDLLSRARYWEEECQKWRQKCDILEQPRTDVERIQALGTEIDRLNEGLEALRMRESLKQGSARPSTSQSQPDDQRQTDPQELKAQLENACKQLEYQNRSLCAYMRDVGNLQAEVDSLKRTIDAKDKRHQELMKKVFHYEKRCEKLKINVEQLEQLNESLERACLGQASGGIGRGCEIRRNYPPKSSEGACAVPSTARSSNELLLETELQRTRDVLDGANRCINQQQEQISSLQADIANCNEMIQSLRNAIDTATTNHRRAVICKKCYMRPVDRVLDCGHCICKECGRELSTSKCPIQKNCPTALSLDRHQHPRRSVLILECLDWQPFEVPNAGPSASSTT